MGKIKDYIVEKQNQERLEQENLSKLSIEELKKLKDKTWSNWQEIDRLIMDKQMEAVGCKYGYHSHWNLTVEVKKTDNSKPYSVLTASCSNCKRSIDDSDELKLMLESLDPSDLLPF